MMGEGQTKDGVKKFAEVFTPANVVFFMLLQPHFINEGEPLRDLDKTIFDPCCGQGQFGWLEAEIIINNRVKCTNSLEFMLEDIILFQIFLMRSCVFSIHNDFYNAANLETKITRIFQMLMVFYFAIMFWVVYLNYLTCQLRRKLNEKN